MKSKLCVIITIILLLGSLFVIPVSATEIIPTDPEEPLDPETPYVDLVMLSSSCSVNNSNGLATFSCFANTANTTYTIYLSMGLYRYKNGSWQLISGPWSGSSTHIASLYKQYYVTPGYYYGSAVAATVYTANGNFVESAILYSPSAYY